MTNPMKLSLLAGVALLGLSLATPASAAPGGSYQQSCRDIQQHYSRGLTAVCQTRDGSWVDARLESTDCSGDIANINGRLVCNENDDRSADNGRMRGDGYGHRDAYNNDNDNERQADRDDRRSNSYPSAYDNNPRDGESYGDRHYGYSGGDNIMPRGQLVRRMERQGYMDAHDLRPIRDGDDWRAMASWHGRDVVVRINPRNGRVISARFI